MEFPENSVTTTVSGKAATSKICSPLYRRNMTPDKRSSGSIQCRICHEDSGIEELIDLPCKCKGSLGPIHRSCLEKWLSTSNKNCCEVCEHPFEIQKKNKPFSQSFREWWRTRENMYGPHGVAADIACLIVLTPLCLTATYLCAIGASTYTSLGYWEGKGLAVLCIILVATYFLWLIVTIRFHFKSWQRWCTGHQDVKLVMKREPGVSSNHRSQIKTLVNVDQDGNNNNAVQSNRLTDWIFIPRNNNNTVQQESTIV
ncbi:E3 ubiquitin-protein ligase MARCH2-like [Ceratina calcarata]|uniref:E3 ubiquitin-protein ligase MARCH2-like n=1 Tax=Ceratina calcarata TaxID=156304 RepID=A0AAJ7N789_9HYME|nr:E3 ubiquitin-protein ligase MARCH2-like [Ceratina calcarata]